MLKIEKFILSYETVLFLPEYDDRGNLTTVVIENGVPIKVDMKPTELIDYNLRYFGSSLRGAGDGSRMILGEISMYPIVMNEKLGIYWFPSMSPLRADCVWFAIHHIEDYKAIGKKKTKVFLSDKSTVTLDISLYSFEKKLQRTYTLKFKMEDRTSKLVNEVRKPKQYYYIMKKENSRNYKLIIKEM